MNSKESFLTPQLRSAIAKAIVLSHAGRLHFRRDGLRFPVRQEDGSVVEKTVSSIFYGRGFSKDWRVLFDRGRDSGIVSSPRDLRKLYDFILDNFPWPREYRNVRLLTEQNALRENNSLFIFHYGDLDEDDFKVVGAIRARVAADRAFRRKAPVPKPGDVVEGAYYGGVYRFKGGMIESISPGGGKLSVCAVPYGGSGHAYLSSDGSLRTSVSGGPFFAFAPEDFEYVGKGTTRLWTWGHEGPCGSGGVHFPVKVNRWRIRDGVDY